MINTIINITMVIIRSTYRTIEDIDLFVGGSLEQVLMAITIHDKNFQPHHKALKYDEGSLSTLMTLYLLAP